MWFYRKKYWLTLLVGFYFSTGVWAAMTKEQLAGLEKEEEKTAPLKKEIGDDYAQSIRKAISFYGKVVDQDNNPVKDVEVELVVRDWTQAYLDGTGDKPYSLKTDKNGLFSIRKENGHFVFIRNLKKTEYEYDRMINITSFDYKDMTMHQSSTGENISFSPDPKNPIVFHLRKRVPAEYLVKRDFMGRFYLNEKERPSQFDKPPFKVRILEMWADRFGDARGVNKERIGMSDAVIYPETYEVQCQFNEDGSQFDLSLMPASKVFFYKNIINIYK